MPAIKYRKRRLSNAAGLGVGLYRQSASDTSDRRPITTAAIAFLVFTGRISSRMKLGLLIVLALLPAWAALNNLLVIRTVGLLGA